MLAPPREGDRIGRCRCWVKLGLSTMSESRPLSLDSDGTDGVIGRQLVDRERFWVLRFRLMVKRGSRVRPQASEGEAQQHGPFCWTGRVGQGHQRLHCG